jgi:hypothetical protein
MERFMDAFDDPFFGVSENFAHAIEDYKLLSVGCVPVRSLHKSVHQGDNETSLSFLVSEACGTQATPQGLHSIRVSVDSEAGELDVHASIEGEDDGKFSERVLLPQRADIDKISSSYDEASHSLIIKIPLKPINKREVPLTVVPKPVEKVDAKPSSEAEKPADKGKGGDAAAAFKDKLRALEHELARIKGTLS